MSIGFQATEPLAGRHDISTFTCRSTEPTHWLRDLHLALLMKDIRRTLRR